MKEKIEDIYHRKDLKEFLRSDELKIFLTFFLIFTLFINWGGSNSWSRYDMTKAMVEDQSFEITPYANNTQDKAIHLTAVHDQLNMAEFRNTSGPERERMFLDAIARTPDSELNIYSDKAPMTSFLSIPGYIAGKMIADSIGDPWRLAPGTTTPLDISSGTALKQFLIVLTVSCLFGAALMVLIYRYLQEHVERKTAIFTVVIAGLGTPLLTYSSSLFGIVNAAFFAFGSFLALEKFQEKQNSKWIYLSGILAAFAVSTEYYMGLIIPLLLGYHYLNEGGQKIPHFLGGAALGSIPMFLYHWTITGGLMPVQMSPNFYQPGPIESVCTVYAYCDVQRTIGGFLLAPFRGINTFFRLLFFETRGLFYYSPVLLLSIPGIYHIYKQDRKLLLITPGIFLSLLLMQSFYINWLAGVSFGPRYILPSIPFLMIPLAFTLERIRKTISAEGETE